MSDMSPAMRKAVEEVKENLEEVVEKGAAAVRGFETRMADINQKLKAEQQKLSQKVVDKLQDAMKWEDLPEKIDTDTKAAMIYYIQTEPMAESHFKGTVIQDFIARWNGDPENGVKGETHDPETVKVVQAELNKLQADMQPLGMEKQQLMVEMQMSNPMPFQPGAPLLRVVATPPEAGEDEWQVAFIPFIVDENMELQTDNLPFEFYVGAYLKGEGISDNFNMSADIKRLSTNGAPVVVKFKANDAEDLKDKILFVVGHVEQNGQPIEPIAMPPSLLGNNTSRKIGQDPTPQGGKGPRLMN